MCRQRLHRVLRQLFAGLHQVVLDALDDLRPELVERVFGFVREVLRDVLGGRAEIVERLVGVVEDGGEVVVAFPLTAPATLSWKSPAALLSTPATVSVTVW